MPVDEIEWWCEVVAAMKARTTKQCASAALFCLS
tara:strand:+ start:1563 stop:1664 length:102 start_codon:yes stop_codon:yes gene_type:complete